MSIMPGQQVDRGHLMEEEEVPKAKRSKTVDLILKNQFVSVIHLEALYIRIE